MGWISVNDAMPEEGPALKLKQLDGTVFDQDDIYYFRQQYSTSYYDGPIYFTSVTHWM